MKTHVTKILFLALALAGTTASAAPLPNAGGLQSVHARDGREILADAKGLSVYTFAPDQNDASVCYKGCAVAWPPVLVGATEVVQAPFGTAPRKDGTLQLTYNHRPLYTYEDDKVAGDIFGDGDGGVWFVIQTSKP